MAKVAPHVISKPCLHFDFDAGLAVQVFHTPGTAGWGQRARMPSRISGLVSGFAERLLCALLCASLSTFSPTPLAAQALPGQVGSQTDMTPPSQTNPPGSQQGNGTSTNMRSGQDPDPIAHGIEEHMAERRNSERQKMLVADTDKLLALAQQLKAEVDKSNKDVLSIDVVKRAEQIEKLAKSVKEKMRGN